ncbi:MAG: asparagine--tRNA ligase [Clostridia bacterium]|nr:asparagine--tRNA ligase [Clostridia bacterium]
MTILDLKDVFAAPEQFLDQQITLQGWVRNHRRQKSFGFINFYDGTMLRDLQIVYENDLPNFEEVQKWFIGSAIRVTGTLVKSQGKNQAYELKATELVLEGASTEDYPLQPKKHSLEYLREIAYLRPRTKLFQSVFRIRNLAAAAIHDYFQSRGYVYVHTPLITGNDAEGAGQTFQVTTLDVEKISGKVDYSRDFFGKKTCLAVTGQLEAEIYAMGFKRVYTFGPTFRAENSNTKTHAAEFWMIEPEIAFCDLHQLMDVEEDFLKYIVRDVMEKGAEELAFLEQYTKTPLRSKLEALVNSKIARVSHEEAITILRERHAKKKFDNEPKYGEDTAKEHEKYLTEEYFKSPCFVYNWPKDIKSFYMRRNEDGKTVAAVDLLVQGSGELMGGSQREERYDVLKARMDEMHIPTGKDGLGWYLDLRKYGGCVHSGFGMGFERLLIFLTGVDNIRDVVPFPRTPSNCEF